MVVFFSSVQLATVYTLWSPETHALSLNWNDLHRLLVHILHEVSTSLAALSFVQSIF